MKSYSNVFVLTSVVVAVCMAIPSLGTGGEPAKGKTVFETHCVVCHGVKGKGDGPAGQALQPPPANLTSAGTKKKSDDSLLNIIRNGKLGTAMVPWKGTLSEQQLHDVLAYIRQLPS